MDEPDLNLLISSDAEPRAAEASEGTALSLLLFGAFEVTCRGRPLPKLRSRKDLWLLALLILKANNRPVSRSWLAGTLWPDTIERDALFNLRRSLSFLREALGPEAERISAPTPRYLQIDLSGADCDVARFDEIVRTLDDDLATQDEIVRLYRGTLLSGCQEEWVFAERERRKEAAISALERLFADARQHGDLDGVQSLLRRILELDPLRESAARSLMEALAMHGRLAEATAVYRAFRLALRHKLKAEPTAELVALGRAIEHRAKAGVGPISSAPAIRPPATSHFPVPRSGIVGRDRDRHAVISQLRLTPLVTLIGPGGVGKTRLSLTIAGALEPDFPDGVHFVDLTAVTDGSLLSRAVIATLGIQEKRGYGADDLLLDYLRPRRLLLILDNCEQLTTDCARLSESLLNECADLKILATSRESLRVYGEVSYALSGLPVDDAVLLFAESAFRADVTVSSSDSVSVARICARLDGLPLAIEMAAARTRALPVAWIATRLDESFRLLGSLDDTDRPPRHQTLQATFDWSYDLLTENERLLLTSLSVFVGGWTLEAAEDVCSELDGIQSGDVLDLLASLADKSLIVFTVEDESNGRYNLLETIRQYGQEKLRQIGLESRLRLRHAANFLRLADASEKPMMGPEQSHWRRILGAEIDNFRAALRWYESEAEAGSDGLHGVRLTRALLRFWLYGGMITEAREWARKALQYSDGRLFGDDLLWRTRLLGDSGSLAYGQGDYVEARLLSEQSFAIYEADGNLPGMARCTTTLGSIAERQSDFEDARKKYEYVLAYWRTTGNEIEIAASLSNLATPTYMQGDFESARAMQQEALVLRRKVGDLQSIAISLHNSAILAQIRGDYSVARVFHEEALAIRRQGADVAGLASSLGSLGEVLGRLGDRAAWLAMATESLELRRQINDRLGVALELYDLAEIARLNGDYAEARSRFRESLKLRSDLKEQRGIGLCLLSLGAVALADGTSAAAAHVDAAHLCGAFDAIFARLGGGALSVVHRETLKTLEDTLTRALGNAAFAAARAEGQALTVAQAIEVAMRV